MKIDILVMNSCHVNVLLKKVGMLTTNVYLSMNDDLF